jgi:hypothetical protein
VGFAPNGILAVGYDHELGVNSETLKLWDTETRLATTLNGHQATVMALAWSADGKTLATASHDRSVRLWDVNAGECLEVLTHHSAPVRAIAISPDGRSLASGGTDKSLVLRNLAAGTNRVFHEAHDQPVRALTFSIDGRYLVSGGNDEKIMLWNTKDLSLVRSISEGHNVQTLASSPVGSLFVSGNEKNEVELWDMDTGTLVRSFQGHTGKVRSVAFSPDGRTLASGGEDNIVRLWNVTTGQPLLMFPTEHFVNGLAFDTRGRTLAAALHNGTVKIWPADDTGQPSETNQTVPSDVVIGKQANMQTGMVPGGDLVAHFNFESVEGLTTYDETGRHHMRLVGAQIVNRDGRGCLSMGGNGSYATCGNSTPLCFSGAMTLALWVRPVESSGNRYVLSKFGYNISLIDGVPCFSIRTVADDDWDNLSAGSAVPINAWSFICAVVDPQVAQIQLFVDDKLAGSHLWNRAGAGATDKYPLEFGRYTLSNRKTWFHGELDEIQLYATALSPARIAQLYEKTKMLVGN